MWTRSTSRCPTLCARRGPRALDAGKHVLCEKPLVTAADDIETIRAAAQRSGRLVLEAFMYRFAPRWRRAMELLADGAIGAPRIARVGLGFKQYPSTYDIRFDAAVGGGVIWDMGCYAASMSRDVFGDEPHTVFALGHRRPGAEVETSAEALHAAAVLP